MQAKKKPGAGAPVGNQSAVGNSGGAKKGNTNAASANTRAKKLFEEGKELDSNGESAAALEKLKAAIVLDPSNAEAHYLVAHVQYHSTYPITGVFNKELYESCITHLNKAMALGHAQAQHLLVVIIVRGETGHGGVYSTEDQNFVFSKVP